MGSRARKSHEVGQEVSHAQTARPSPQLVKPAELEIGWTPAARISPGEYPAYARYANVYYDRQFRRFVCAVQFDVLRTTMMRPLARLPWYLNLGSREKPHAGRRSCYWKAWLIANGKPPARIDRLSPHVFTKRYARVIVADITKDYRQENVGEAGAYSVIRSVVRWETSASE